MRVGRTQQDQLRAITFGFGQDRDGRVTDAVVAPVHSDAVAPGHRGRAGDQPPQAAVEVGDLDVQLFGQGDQREHEQLDHAAPFGPEPRGDVHHLPRDQLLVGVDRDQD